MTSGETAKRPAPLLTVRRRRDGQILTQITLPRGRPFVVGRDTDCDLEVVRDDRTLSRHHVELEVLPGDVVAFRDLDSTNGTHLNGIETRTGTLGSGADLLRVGQYELSVFRRQSGPPTTQEDRETLDIRPTGSDVLDATAGAVRQLAIRYGDELEHLQAKYLDGELSRLLGCPSRTVHWRLARLAERYGLPEQRGTGRIKAIADHIAQRGR